MATIASVDAIAAIDVRECRWSKLGELIPSAIILAVGLLMTAWLYVTPAYVPDEVWFRDLAADKTASLADHGLWTLIRTQDNQLGYGAIYWIVYAMLGRWFADPLAAARWLAFASMASVPSCAAVYAWRTGSRFGWLAVLLWFTFPMCWWTGKLTGPETYSLALSTIGVTILLLQRRHQTVFVAAVLLGLAIGIKLTVMPVLLFAALVTWQRSERKRDVTIMAGCGLFVGFVVANPFLLIRPGHFVNVLQHLPNDPNYPGPSLSMAHVAYLYSNTIWEWDGVFRGGFFNWGLAAPAFAAWVVFLWRAKADRPVVIAYLLTKLFATALFLVQARYMGWYWFPIIALIPLITCDARVLNKREIVALAAGLLLLNVTMSQRLIRQQCQTKLTHLAAIHEGPQLQQSIEAQIRSESPGISRLSWCLPPGVVRHPTDPASVLGADDFQVYCESPAYTWIFENRFLADVQTGHTDCIVLYRPYRAIWDYVRDHPALHVAERLLIREVALDQKPVDLVFLRRR